ncbi:MAG: NAD(P)H-dependent oxidoreductase [Candidatus Riflebacteria bacterium]|nr:NAD(P)H-dependent oxidoreductase [Candidatus Riflebacteria bacterium]
MHVLSILGSPRKTGNTAQVLDWVEEQLVADGHRPERIPIVDLKVEGCQECMCCKTGEATLCATEDDGNRLFQKMIEADLVLLSAPVFCWGFPAQIKGFIDRLYCLMDLKGEPPQGAPRLHGKSMALLLTAGGVAEGNSDLLVRGFDNLIGLLKAKSAGHLVITQCTTPSALDERVKKRATDFARHITAR